MKNILIIGLVLLGLSSCDDFLEYKDKDKIIPKELSHFDEFIYGEIIKRSEGTLMNYLPYMTDEAESYVTLNTKMTPEELREDMFQYYTWAQEPQINVDGTENEDKAWSFFYHNILMCNVVLNELNELEEDTEGTKSRLLGEALFLRAQAYFYLVNLFGEPYENETQAATALGVPINNNVGVEANVYHRATLKANYELIEQDLKDAIQYLEKGQVKGGIYRPHKDVAQLLLSRVYLFQKKYDDVISICNELLGSTKASILPYNTLESFISTSGSVTCVRKLYNTANPSILYSWSTLYVETTGFASDIIAHSRAFFIVSNELLGLYDENDIRLTRYYDKTVLENYDKQTYYFATKNYSKFGSSGEGYSQAMRLEEAYLNRAEAYIESGDYESGMDDINAIRVERISKDPELIANSVEEARDYCRLERRLEFSFEGMRWFDIRRWGLEIVHKYHDYNNPTVFDTYVLKAGSPNYILPLPLEIQRNDDVIEHFKREDTKL